MSGHHHEITNENETKVLFVIVFTLFAMVVEVAFGYFTHSMALLADGFHMLTHALALGLTYVAYILIRKFKNSPHFANGTDKIGTLAGYTSSLFLGFTGLWIIVEAIDRLINPQTIGYKEAITVALAGLIVNLICIFIMQEKHHDEHEEDYNYKSAYYHILADILTSVLAIFALLSGKYFNIVYFDSLVGILGGILILKWSINLIKNTVKILIDMK